MGWFGMEGLGWGGVEVSKDGNGEKGEVEGVRWGGSEGRR